MLNLVDGVLANAPAALREACSCRGILARLETVGAYDVPTLLEHDYAEVKLSISGAALPAFVSRLKEAVLLLPASAVPATPGPLFRLYVLFRPRAVCVLMPQPPRSQVLPSTRQVNRRLVAAGNRTRRHQAHVRSW